ncbi:hypothetical protein [Nitrosomonas communis]|nr:hypothetical protein [Nitrosomonas communis]
MSDWCGACDFDVKDNDITGAVSVAAVGKVNFYAIFSGRVLFRLLTEVG